jgi:hypothetical protein
MPKLVLTVLFLLTSHAAYAQTFTQADFAITPFAAGEINFDVLQLDVQQTPRFLQAQGMVRSSASSSGYPLDGTCFTTSDDGVFCSLRYGRYTLVLTLNSSINGSYQIQDTSGELVVSGDVALLSAN